MTSESSSIENDAVFKSLKELKLAVRKFAPNINIKTHTYSQVRSQPLYRQMQRRKISGLQSSRAGSRAARPARSEFESSRDFCRLVRAEPGRVIHRGPTRRLEPMKFALRLLD